MHFTPSAINASLSIWIIIFEEWHHLISSAWWVQYYVLTTHGYHHSYRQLIHSDKFPLALQQFPVNWALLQWYRIISNIRFECFEYLNNTVSSLYFIEKKTTKTKQRQESHCYSWINGRVYFQKKCNHKKTQTTKNKPIPHQTQLIVW